MKNLFLLLFFSLAIIAGSFAQIPNNGFETWTAVGTHFNPDSWGHLNEVTASGNSFTCMKGAPGSPGTAYLKLVSKNVTGMGIVPGVACCGTLNPTTRKPVAGFPYTIRSQKLTGKWQHMSDSDQGYIDVLLTVWNSNLNKRDTVAYKHTVLGPMVMSWATFNITLNYLSGATPDSAIIFFSASPATPVASDYLYIDNLSFSGTVVGINDTKMSENKFDIFPNPCHNNLNLSLYIEKSSQVIIQLYDITGKLIKTDNLGILNGTVEKNISTNTLVRGLYFLNIVTDKNSIVKRFTVE